ncbi:MAG TPA: alpha/beta fold hydrolase [Micromonosporaceae bacterium]|nr:alpha/beta fold hydrolase [Micromonosporaceae bacterium]
MRIPTRILTISLTVIALIMPGAAAGAATTSGRPQSIAWAPCPEDPTAECGTLRVPVDWDRPHGATFDLALARRKATDPAARIGSLVINPGGPGGSGVDFAIFAPDYFSPELRRHFDLVGFDPRGVARSHPVVCSLELLSQTPPTIMTSQADFDAMVAFNRALGRDCRARTGPLFDHVDTLSVVRDIDAIRAAVGDKRLTYYGVSYGTLMGQQYAEEFPHHVRALVLDSNMDHSLGTRGFLDTEAATTQDVFTEFVTGCGNDSRCSLFGQDIKALWGDLLARAARGELRLPGAPPDSPPLSPFDLQSIAFGAFYGPDWFGLADFLAALDATPPAAARLQADEVAENPFQAVFCEDWRLPVRDYREFAAHLDRMAGIAPDYKLSPLAVFATVACLGWPARVNNPQHELRVRHSPTLFMTNSLHDPATAYSWATDAARQLGGSAVLLTYDGWGHGVYGRGPCPTDAMDSYLIASVLPARGSHCPAVLPQPFGVSSASGGRPLPSGPRPGLPGWW